MKIQLDIQWRRKNLIIQSWTYREQYGFNSVILLPANLYGPHDNFDLETSHVVPALIRKFLEAKQSGASEVEVWGTGVASREFLYSVDTAQAILGYGRKCKRKWSFQSWNRCGNNNQRISRNNSRFN
jgi:nucleoside-diphosphate-sugar epimerase